MKTPTPKQALAILDGICAGLNFDRKTHDSIRLASTVLENFIAKHSSKPAKKKNEFSKNTKDN